MMNQQIAVNRKALHDYFIEEQFEGGLCLFGWEVKSLREGKGQLLDSHIVMRQGEAWLLNAHISPLLSASTHVVAEPTRSRKILLHAAELARLIGKVEQKGYTLIPLSLYWKRGRVKVTVALARGKKQHDKREVEKSRDWQRERARVLRRING